MTEVTISIPENLEKEIGEFQEDWSEIALEAIKSRLFILQLSRSKELQRAVLESLSSKSKLTEKGALELGNKIKKGMLKELEDNGLV